MGSGNLRHTWLILLALAARAPVYGQFEITLAPKTLEAYRNYVRNVDTELVSHWQGRSDTALALDGRPDEKAKVHNGEFAVWEPAVANRGAVPDGMIHDWIGAMYLPGAKVADVLLGIDDWKDQKRFYPEVVDSKLISRQGDSVVGYWRLRRTKFITVVLDVDLLSKVKNYGAVSTVTTTTTRVSEVLNPGGMNEKVLPSGEGHGYLWAFDAFWTLRQEQDGVFAECRTISLSRTIPPSLAWMVAPLIDSMPRESLLSTLRGTRKACFKH